MKVFDALGQIKKPTTNEVGAFRKDGENRGLLFWFSAAVAQQHGTRS